jgi:hypothetical protein
MAQQVFVPSKNSQTWDTISGRLSKFTPAITLTDYIDVNAHPPDVREYTSEGINFVLSKAKREEFLRVLRLARTATDKKAFEEGRWKGALHAAKGALSDLASGITGDSDSDSWALNVSLKATKGIGFRQIWYLELTDRQLRLKNARPAFSNSPQLDLKFSAMFDAPNRGIDLSSLHWAIGDPDPKTSQSQCNVHIDQVGVLANLGGTPGLTPDLGYHTLVELAFRTGLKGLVPDVVLQHMDFIMPSSHENYAFNFGAQINFIDRKDLKLSLRGICGIHNDGAEWSTTINVWGKHDIFGGKGQGR